MTIDQKNIHLWIAEDQKITDPILLNKYHKLLNEEEIAKKKCFKLKKHEDQYLITRAMVRVLLSHYIPSVDPAAWMFVKNTHGKPFIANFGVDKSLSFSLSHTDSMIVMAVVPNIDVAIGVDIESVNDEIGFKEIASRFFSKIERQQMQMLSEHEQKKRFFELWTLKESYIKACGLGLSIPLDHFSFEFLEQNRVSIAFHQNRNDSQEYWRFWRLYATDRHIISLAIKDTTSKNKRLYSVRVRKIIPFKEMVDTNLQLMCLN